MIAMSGTSLVRARTARSAASIIRRAGRPAPGARRAGARAAPGNPRRIAGTAAAPRRLGAPRRLWPHPPRRARAALPPRPHAAPPAPPAAPPLVADADAKVLDPRRLVAAQALAKLLLPHVERREMERAFAHSALPSRVARSASGAPAVALGPNRTVPKRIAVAPSSTAIP